MGAEQVVRGVVLAVQQPGPVAVVEGLRLAYSLAAGSSPAKRRRNTGIGTGIGTGTGIDSLGRRPLPLGGAGRFRRGWAAAFAGAAGDALPAGVTGGACGASTSASISASVRAGDVREGLRAVTGTASSEGVGGAERGGRNENVNGTGGGLEPGDRGGAPGRQSATTAARRWIAAIGTGSQSGR